MIFELDTDLGCAHRGYVTRRVPAVALHALDKPDAPLRSGDIVLAKVTAIGQHKALELPAGRRKMLNIGDQIIVACGARYAPDQFHAVVPEAQRPANLVAAGGIAGIELARHARMKPATEIEIVARLLDRSDQPVNLIDYALPMLAPQPVPVVVVAGTSMNSGKTATCAALIRGFKASGLKPAYVKATGTGSGGDVWQLSDAGAVMALDFTDAGYSTTYHAQPNLVASRALNLARHATRSGADVVVMEIADGLLQQETAAILADAEFRTTIAGVVFAAVDSMGAVAGRAWLERHSHRVFAVSGAFTQAPLAMREYALATGDKSMLLDEIAGGRLTSSILAWLEQKTSDMPGELPRVAA